MLTYGLSYSASYSPARRSLQRIGSRESVNYLKSTWSHCAHDRGGVGVGDAQSAKMYNLRCCRTRSCCSYRRCTMAVVQRRTANNVAATITTVVRRTVGLN